jgi:hypothetical protein
VSQIPWNHARVARELGIPEQQLRDWMKASGVELEEVITAIMSQAMGESVAQELYVLTFPAIFDDLVVRAEPTLMKHLGDGNYRMMPAETGDDTED